MGTGWRHAPAWIAAEGAAEDEDKLAMLLEEETADGGAAGAAGAAAGVAGAAGAGAAAGAAGATRRRALRARAWAKSSQRRVMA